MTSDYRPSRLFLADFIENLSLEQVQQVADVLNYMGGLTVNNRSGHVPEGSIAALLVKQPDYVQTVVRGLQEVATTPRDAPYERKRSSAEILDSLGFDHQSATTILDVLDTTDVAGGLMNSMGTDADRTPDPRTARDDVADALEAHEPQRKWAEYGNAMVADAGAFADLSLRDNIEICGDHKAEMLGENYEKPVEVVATDMRNDIAAALEKHQ